MILMIMIRKTDFYEQTALFYSNCRFERMTILSSLRIDGTTEALVFDGALNGEMFEEYMKKC